MNRRELLDRASATAEERLLLGRVWDKYEQCRSRCVPTHTEFLSPQEQAAARRLLQAIGAEESEYAFFGGYEGAEEGGSCTFCPTGPSARRRTRLPRCAAAFTRRGRSTTAIFSAVSWVWV